jgi:hypothetical protein
MVSAAPPQLVHRAEIWATQTGAEVPAGSSYPSHHRLFP